MTEFYRDFLNPKGHGLIGAVLLVGDEYEGMVHEMTLSISDCARTIDLVFGLSSIEDCNTSMYKVRKLKRALVLLEASIKASQESCDE